MPSSKNFMDCSNLSRFLVSPSGLAAAQKTIVGIDIARSAVGNARLFGWAESHFERFYDAASDIVLDRKEIRQVPVVAFGP